MCGPTARLSASEEETAPSKILESAPRRSVENMASQRKASPNTQAEPKTTAKRSRYATVGGLKLLEFHGMMGILSLTTSILTIALWDDKYFTSLSCSLVLVSILASTVLSIHSSWKMLDHAPVQTVIWDLQKESTLAKSIDSSTCPMLQQMLLRSIRALDRQNLLPFTKIVAPHREAFHRTSLILQYVNARIFQQLVERSIWSNSLPLCILAWMMVIFTCLRMIPDPWCLDYRNGNTFCFVVPMVCSVIGDFAMTIFTEWVNSRIQHAVECCWLTLRELAVVQLAGLVIAFLFTLAFRSKNRKVSSFHIPIRPLYYFTAAGVYLLVAVGVAKAKHSMVASESPP